MPSPIGHSLAGYAIYVNAVETKNKNWKLLVFCILVANLPDFDFLPGFILGEPNKFHHGISHSIGFVCLIAISLSIIATKKRTVQLFLQSVLLFGSLYFSHVFLDYFSVDTLIPFGEKLFWPISDDYYISSIKLFLNIKRNISSNSEFLLSLINLHNMSAIALEMCLLFPIIGLSYFIRNRINSNGI